MKKCYIVAGPNGAGKTTFARTYLPKEADCLNFVNADLIAEGISPLQPEAAAIEAGKMLLRRIEEFVANGESFAFETTLSGLSYTRRIPSWREEGYRIVLFYLRLPSVDLAIERVRMRVRAGGHNVPEETVRRRFTRSWENFQHHYSPLADKWVVFDNSGEHPIVMEHSG